MMRSGSKAGLSLAGLVALGVWSCSGDGENSPTESAAGAGASAAAGHHQGGSGAQAGGGAAGDGGSAGDRGGAAGAGGSAGAGGNAGDACEARTLQAYCSQLESRVVPQACPKSPADFELGREQCGRYNGVSRYASDCGGVIIEVWGDKMDGANYYSYYYSFDAQGELVGVAFANDVPDECPGWGEPCARVGDPEPLCSDGGAGGQGGAGGAGSGAGGAH
ncbi:MAG: hypothetical protein ABUL60_08590 [Myxococcales bacterium]